MLCERLASDIERVERIGAVGAVLEQVFLGLQLNRGDIRVCSTIKNVLKAIVML